MPQATLDVPILYPFVGVYRLFHDPNLWKPMWRSCFFSVTKGTALAAAWTFITFPVQSFFSRVFLGGFGSAVGAKATYNTLSHFCGRFGLPFISFETMTILLLLLNQAHAVLEMSIGTQLRRFRTTAYQATVDSRGKPASFWTPYTEEFAKPPSRHGASASRRSVSDKAVSVVKNRMIKMVMRKTISIVFGAVPLFGFLVYAVLGGFEYACSLHRPYFEAKHMNAQQVSLWTEERKNAYFVFGCMALILERVPIFGLVFSVSNRIGAAMWAHDLEKRQHRFQSGEIDKIAADSSTKYISDDQPGGYGRTERSDVALPGDIHAPPAA